MPGSSVINEHQPKPCRQVFGRRQGKKLRKHQAVLMERLLPRLAVPDPSDGQTLDPRGLFGDKITQQVWLEIGFGGGEHLAALAKAHPHIGFIGCEPFINGVAKLLAEIDRQALPNIRIFNDDARLLLDALKPASLDRVFLLFPDPWPKKRHHKRRFVSPENLDLLAGALVDGGEFRVATDIGDYCRWTLDHLRRHPAPENPLFEWTAQTPRDWRRPAPSSPEPGSPEPAPLKTAAPGQKTSEFGQYFGPKTRYEAKARAQGRRPVHLSFRRVARSARKAGGRA